eukprot:UC4_evm1s138
MLFIEKNKDQRFQDFKRLMFQSGDNNIKQIFPDGAKSITEVNKRPISAGKGFVTSMKKLVELLMAKEPYYVRCIKPNEKKSPTFFDMERCVHQVQYLNLVENLRIRRAGYANRQKYEVFYARYKLICPQTWPNWKGGGGSQSAARAILQQENLLNDVAF